MSVIRLAAAAIDFCTATRARSPAASTISWPYPATTADSSRAPITVTREPEDGNLPPRGWTY